MHSFCCVCCTHDLLIIIRRYSFCYAHFLPIDLERRWLPTCKMLLGSLSVLAFQYI